MRTKSVFGLIGLMCLTAAWGCGGGSQPSQSAQPVSATVEPKPASDPSADVGELFAVDKQQQKQDKFDGTANCTFEYTVDGKTKKVTSTTAECRGEASYESARRALEAKITAAVRAQNGTITGAITFSIKKSN